MTLTSLSSERDRLHVNHSVFYQDLNTNFLKKKLGRDKNKKSLTGNVSRTTEVNDPNEIDATPEDGHKAESNNEDINAKNTQIITNKEQNFANGVKDVKEKQVHNKFIKEKQRPDGHKSDKNDNINKNKVKSENTQGNISNPKQNVNQPKNKQQQQQNKYNVADDSSEEERKSYIS